MGSCHSESGMRVVPPDTALCSHSRAFYKQKANIRACFGLVWAAYWAAGYLKDSGSHCL